jgi:hypothetical protein
VHLLAHLGFVETSTPCLFRHPTRSIAFVLVVDDVGIKYQSRDDYEYFVHCLSSLYHVTAHPIATKFLGFTLKYDRQLRTFAVSYPGYADALLTRLRLEGVKPCDKHSVYKPPRFGFTTPQVPPPTLSPPPPPPNERTWRWPSATSYTMAVLSTRAYCLSPVPSPEQSIATLGTVKRLNRILGIVAGRSP